MSFDLDSKARKVTVYVEGGRVGFCDGQRRDDAVLLKELEYAGNGEMLDEAAVLGGTGGDGPIRVMVSDRKRANCVGLEIESFKSLFSVFRRVARSCAAGLVA